MNTKKLWNLLSITIVIGMSSQLQAWSHDIYNNTSEPVLFTPHAMLGGSTVISKTIPADGQKHTLDMGGWLTSGFTVEAQTDNSAGAKNYVLTGLRIYEGHPWFPDTGPGMTFVISKEEDLAARRVVDTGSTIETHGKVRLKADVTHWNGKDVKTFYSPYKNYITTKIKPAPQRNIIINEGGNSYTGGGFDGQGGNSYSGGTGPYNEGGNSYSGGQYSNHGGGSYQ